MINDRILRKALQTAPLSGKVGLLFCIAAVAVPTLLRAAVHDLVTSGVFLTYVPFELLAALLLSPRHAAVVALASATVADFFFMHPYYALAADPNDLFNIGVFLITSALIIVSVRTVRSFIENCLTPDASDERRIIFSEKMGEAWAHWDTERPPVKLGPHKEVAEMMEDYIAQVRLGERLTGKSDLPDD
jgi:K+-sensing histidine kinase KdpD